MFTPTIIMGVIAITLFIIAYQKGQGEHITGMKSALNMIFQISSLLFFALIIAGLVQILLPHELLSKWIGKESGFKGIIIGTIAGGLSPGGPYVSLPIVA